MGTPKVGYTKVAVGNETTIRQEAARTARVPVKELAYVKEDITKTGNDIITGRNTNAGLGVDAVDLSTELKTPLNTCPALKYFFQSALGNMSTDVKIAGGLTIAYTGTAESCKLVVTASKIEAFTGKYGAEVEDSKFVTGTLSTLGALATAINAIADYSATVINGLESVAITEFIATTGQAKNHAAPVFAKGTAATLTVFSPNLTPTENPTLTVEFNKVGRNEVGIGGAVDSFDVSGDLKAKMDVSWVMPFLKHNVITTETALEQGASELISMKFNDGNTIINGKNFCYIKSLGWSYANNISADEGFCQGEETKKIHMRGVTDITGNMTVTLTDGEGGTQEQADMVRNNKVGSLQTIFKGTKIADGLFNQVIFDAANIQYTSYDKSGSDASIDLSLEYTVVDVMTYGDFFKVYMVSEN